MPGDPTSAQQFSAVNSFLTAITCHFTEVAGPWFATTPQEIIEVHHDYLCWCSAIAQFGEGTVHKPLPFTLQNLAALSCRRMQALEQFGGTAREDYPIYSHLHKIILFASNRESCKWKQWSFSKTTWQKLHFPFIDPDYCSITRKSLAGM